MAIHKRKTKTTSKLRAVDPRTGWRLYYPNRETMLYYVEFNDHGKLYYKIGITTRTVKKRFAGDQVPYRVLWSKTYRSGRSAYIREQKILKKYAKHLCNGVYILRSGNCELFSKNIMKDAYGT